MFAPRFLGSPGGKHCNSIERNVWRNVVSTLKKTILVSDHRFFAAESKKNFAHVLLSNQIGNSGSGLYYSKTLHPNPLDNGHEGSGKKLGPDRIS